MALTGRNKRIRPAKVKIEQPKVWEVEVEITRLDIAIEEAIIDEVKCFPDKIEGLLAERLLSWKGRTLKEAKEIAEKVAQFKYVRSVTVKPCVDSIINGNK